MRKNKRQTRCNVNIMPFLIELIDIGHPIVVYRQNGKDLLYVWVRKTYDKCYLKRHGFGEV